MHPKSRSNEWTKDELTMPRWGRNLTLPSAIGEAENMLLAFLGSSSDTPTIKPFI